MHHERAPGVNLEGQKEVLVGKGLPEAIVSGISTHQGGVTHLASGSDLAEATCPGIYANRWRPTLLIYRASTLAEAEQHLRRVRALARSVAAAEFGVSNSSKNSYTVLLRRWETQLRGSALARLSVPGYWSSIRGFRVANGFSH